MTNFSSEEVSFGTILFLAVRKRLAEDIGALLFKVLSEHEAFVDTDLGKISDVVDQTTSRILTDLNIMVPTSSSHVGTKHEKQLFEVYLSNLIKSEVVEVTFQELKEHPLVVELQKRLEEKEFEEKAKKATSIGDTTVNAINGATSSSWPAKFHNHSIMT